MNIHQGRRDISGDQLNKLIACFAPLKAEDDPNIQFDDIFVRTKAFDDLTFRQLNRTNTVLLGRKGDGKTALLRRLQFDIQTSRHESNPKHVEAFHKFDIEKAYFVELITKFSSVCTCIRQKHPNIAADHIAKQIWVKFLTLTAIHQISSTYGEHYFETNPHEKQDRESQKRYFQNLVHRTQHELGSIIRPNTTDSSQAFISYLD